MRRTAVGALALALVTGLAGCGGDKLPGEKAPAPAAITPVGTGNPFGDLRVAAGHMPAEALTLATGLAKGGKLKGDPASNAAELRAKLAALLTEHVYLVGGVVATLYHFGDNTPPLQAAAGALDANATDLAALIGTISTAKQSAFLESWRAHDEDFYDYAKGAKADDDAAKHTAANNLLDYAKTAGQFFSDLTGSTLSASGVSADFVTHISALTQAIDAMAAGTPDALGKLKTAADHMADSAQVLASGIARSADVSGDSTSPPAKLRADLTGLLTAHVYLAGLAVFTAYTNAGGTDSTAFSSAADTVDVNSQDLATVIGGAVGKDKQDHFLQVWRTHIDDFVAYAKADAGDDTKGKNTALNNLDAYRNAAGKFFADASDGGVNADDVSAALKDHVATLAGAIDSLKTGVLDVPVVTPTATPTDLPVFGGSPATASPSATASDATNDFFAPSESSPTGSASPSASATSSPSPSPSATPTKTASAKPSASVTGHSH
jgi:hypothetical protein